ncbi:hypothetical protein AB7281_21305 [Providencia rettgeri]|nr:hypothetical protein [Providencia stuartii]MBN4863792.1 hypothetical protein [Providencia stuartii]MBN4873114.1 hypothetical protein [Providencia stuartii]MBN4877765.1 hypothetical protein [Providencia stuartii]MBN4882315.1 hypothetical protein [Providencia stuartii]
MTNIGREPSVTARFSNQFKRACEKMKLTDITYELAGQDSKANADAIFNALNNFVLVEFKSFNDGVYTEEKKPRVYDLCHRLIKNKPMVSYHRKCHFIIWGITKNGRLETEYTIYQDSICRKSVLINSTFLTEPELPNILDGNDLANEIANAAVGLNLEEFLTYLQWLFSKTRSTLAQYNGAVSLIATSSDSFIDGREFKSFLEFKNWAQPTVSSMLNKISIQKKKQVKTKRKKLQ